jgi:hypothetical protein
VGDRALGGVADVHGAPVVLLQASTYLGDANHWLTPPLETSACLIRAGQSPRPCCGGVPAVLGEDLGWLLELTQGRSLCIPVPQRFALAHPELCAANWQGLLAISHPHDSNVLPAGSVDPCQEDAGTWQIGGAPEACMRFSVVAAMLPALHGTGASCPPLHACIPNTLGSYGCRIVQEKGLTSKSPHRVTELCSRSCTTQQSTAAQVSGRGCLLGWNPTAAYLAGTHRARN